MSTKRLKYDLNMKLTFSYESIILLKLISKLNEPKFTYMYTSKSSQQFCTDNTTM